MDCALHVIDPPQTRLGFGVIPEGRVVLFGLSLCHGCTPRVAKALSDGDSVREIIGRAVAGDWS